MTTCRISLTYKAAIIVKVESIRQIVSLSFPDLSADEEGEWIMEKDDVKLNNAKAAHEALAAKSWPHKLDFDSFANGAEVYSGLALRVPGAIGPSCQFAT